MTYEEAFNIVVKYGFCGDCRWCYEDKHCVEYDCYKGVQLIKEALKKQIPKKPIYYGDGYADGELVYDMAECPNCGNDDFEEDINDWGCNYCPECGQALDWE